MGDLTRPPSSWTVGLHHETSSSWLRTWRSLSKDWRQMSNAFLCGATHCSISAQCLGPATGDRQGSEAGNIWRNQRLPWVGKELGWAQQEHVQVSGLAELDSWWFMKVYREALWWCWVKPWFPLFSLLSSRLKWPALGSCRPVVKSRFLKLPQNAPSLTWHLAKHS